MMIIIIIFANLKGVFILKVTNIIMMMIIIIIFATLKGTFTIIAVDIGSVEDS